MSDEYPFRRFNIAPDEIEFEWVSYRHAALLASLSEAYIRKMALEGVLESRKLAFTNVALVSRSSLEKYLIARDRGKEPAGV